MAQYVLVEKEKCMGPPCGEGEGLDSMCKTTEWSDWSPCSATCGKGVKIRTRFLLVDPELQMKCAARVEIIQQRPCEDTPNCNLSPEVAKGKPMSMIISKNANSFLQLFVCYPMNLGHVSLTSLVGISTQPLELAFHLSSEAAEAIGTIF